MIIKASARHNKQDRQLLRDSLKKANELTNLLSQLGAIEDAEDENENDPEDAVVIEEKNDNGVISPGATVVTGSEKKSVEDDTMTVKAISLDETISNVRDAFYKQFRTGYLYSSDSSDYPYILSVYSDFVVCKCGMNYYKVPYTIGDDKIVFEVRASWVSVEPDWVTKSISHFDDVLKSVKAVGKTDWECILSCGAMKRIVTLARNSSQQRLAECSMSLRQLGKSQPSTTTDSTRMRKLK